MLTVRLVDSFGFTERSLTAHSAILPIAYYLYLKNPGDSFLTHSRFEPKTERKIREWLDSEPAEVRNLGKRLGYTAHGPAADHWRE